MSEALQMLNSQGWMNGVAIRDVVAVRRAFILNFDGGNSTIIRERSGKVRKETFQRRVGNATGRMVSPTQQDWSMGLYLIRQAARCPGGER